MRPEALRRVLEPLYSRLRSLVSRGRVTFSTTATAQVDVMGAVAEVQMLPGPGVVWSPAPGAELILLAVNGQQEHLVAIGGTSLGAPAVQPGEVALYTSTGTQILVKTTGQVCVKGDLIVEGNISAAGDVSDAAGSLAAHRAKFALHIHTDAGGDPTTPPTEPA